MSISKYLTKTSLFTRIDEMEADLAARKDVLHSTKDSPVRFDIIKERLKSNEGGPPVRMLPYMLQCLSGINESLSTLDENPSDPKTKADQDLFREIEELALELGATSIGYTRLPNRWIFKDKAVVYKNAIILTMEMDKEGIESAPSIACMKTVMETYRDLGSITNQLAHLFGSADLELMPDTHSMG